MADFKLDPSRYEGRTPGTFTLRRMLNVPGVIEGGVTRQYTNGTSRDQIAMVCSVQFDNGGSVAHEANANLFADAPQLLGECVRRGEEIERLRSSIADAITTLRRESPGRMQWRIGTESTIAIDFDHEGECDKWIAEHRPYMDRMGWQKLHVRHLTSDESMMRAVADMLAEALAPFGTEAARAALQEHAR